MSTAPKPSPIRHLRPRTESELNQVILRRKRQWVLGVLAAASLADSYNRSTTQKYSLGDCILAKLNLLAPKTRIRKNPNALP